MYFVLVLSWCSLFLSYRLILRASMWDPRACYFSSIKKLSKRKRTRLQPYFITDLRPPCLEEQECACPARLSLYPQSCPASSLKSGRCTRIESRPLVLGTRLQPPSAFLPLSAVFVYSYRKICYRPSRVLRQPVGDIRSIPREADGTVISLRLCGSGVEQLLSS